MVLSSFRLVTFRIIPLDSSVLPANFQFRQLRARELWKQRLSVLAQVRLISTRLGETYLDIYYLFYCKDKNVRFIKQKYFLFFFLVFSVEVLECIQLSKLYGTLFVQIIVIMVGSNLIPNITQTYLLVGTDDKIIFSRVRRITKCK